jgi:hypothetical protein
MCPLLLPEGEEPVRIQSKVIHYQPFVGETVLTSLFFCSTAVVLDRLVVYTLREQCCSPVAA